MTHFTHVVHDFFNPEAFLSFFGPLLHLSQSLFLSSMCRECNKLTNLHFWSIFCTLCTIYNTSYSCGRFLLNHSLPFFSPPLHLSRSLFSCSAGNMSCPFHCFRPVSTHRTGIYQDQMLFFY